MEPRQFLDVLWRWRWLVVSATLIASLVSFVVSTRLPPVYAATTTLVVGVVLQSTNPQQADIAVGEQLAGTYVQYAQHEPVLHATVDSLHLGMPWQALGQHVNASAVPQTQLLQITAMDESPQQAKIIADEVARQLVLQSPTPTEKQAAEQRDFIDRQLTELQARIVAAESQIETLESRVLLETTATGVQDSQGQIAGLQQKVASWQSTYASLLSNRIGSINRLSVLEPAVVPDAPISPNVPLNVAIAAAIGSILSVMGLIVVEYLDDTLKTSDDVTRVLKVPCLAAIGRAVGNQLPSFESPQSPVAEEYRVLRVNLRFALGGAPKPVVFVTSATAGEGKSTIASNLAASIAQTGKHVIICDADLRRPSVHRILGTTNDIGLSDLLADRGLQMQAALRQTRVPRLRVLTSGPPPVDPAEREDSEVMRERIAQLRELADVVIVDGPAVEPVADARLLGVLCTGVLLVLDAGQTRAQVALRGKAIIEQTGAPILGVALNRAKAASEAYHAYYRGRPLEARSGIEHTHEHPAADAGGAVST